MPLEKLFKKVKMFLSYFDNIHSIYENFLSKFEWLEVRYVEYICENVREG